MTCSGQLPAILDHMRFIEKMEDGFVGKRISVRRHLVEIAGKQIPLEIAEVKNAVAILPIHSDGDITLLKHPRYPISIGGDITPMIEVPAGLIEDGESPAGAAKRELAEETGHIADALEFIGELYSSPGITNERIYCFIARNLTCGFQKLDDAEQEIEIIRIPSWQALDWVENNTIKDGKTAYLISRHFQSLNKRT